MRISRFTTALLALVLAACGGGADDAFQPGGGGGGTTLTVATLTVIASSTTLPSDNSVPVEITAYARNVNNNFVSGVPVVFSADNQGSLQITQGTTDENGIAKATLTSIGNAALRTIIVTAQAGTVGATVGVSVTGTALTIQGPQGLTQGQLGTYSVSLRDAGNNPVANSTVTITSARGNTLSPSSVTTDALGLGTFTMTATNGANDTLTASGLGANASLAVTVNSDDFTVISPTLTPPATSTEVPLTGSQVVTVQLRVSGSPAVGQTVNFSTTRGVVTPTSAVTNASGQASTTVTASNAGIAVVTASAGTNSIQAPLEFVALTPASIDVQPSLFAIGPTQTSTITATVRDAAGNLVKNKLVTFTLDDVTGGTLSVGTANTDSQGRAQTVYTASNTTSANGGVKITATVAGVAPKTVQITVARREVFISLGTGNEISEPNTAQYRKEFIVQVTDSNGNGVPNVSLSLRALSTRYWKGFWFKPVPATTPPWSQTISAGPCADEDTNRNGVLDPTEDFNGNGRIEAGNIVTVTPSNAVTDADGFVLVNIYYPQEHAYWLEIDLSANTTVQGTEYVRSSVFTLPGLAADYTSANVSPPGVVSPFGSAGSCNNPL